LSKTSGRFKKSILENGMTLVTESLPHFQSLSIGVWVNAGTRHERPGEEGLSHFLEHMMFKGTETRSALDIALAVDRVGGEFNAFTSREYTCFHLLLLARDIGLASDIMTDVLLNSTFAEEEVERERKVILQEISMVEDNPEELIHDLFFEQAFGNHALGKPILGSPSTVSRFDRNTVFSYFRQHYSPSQMIVSVAGDVSHEEVRRVLNRNLKPNWFDRQRREKKLPEKANLHRPKINAGYKAVKRELEQAHIVTGFSSMAYDDPDRFAAFLLNTYLGGGMSSSLFQEIREKRGLAYTIYSSLAPFSDTGLFSVYVATTPKEASVCLEVMGKELARLKKERLPQEAVDVLKDNLRGTILLNSDSVENRMTSIAKNEMFFGRYYSMSEVTKQIEKVKASDIQRIAKSLFKPEKMVLSIMSPLATAGLGRKLTKHL
jgi:predicted Zn-dependent peptidase